MTLDLAHLDIRPPEEPDAYEPPLIEWEAVEVLPRAGGADWLRHLPTARPLRVTRVRLLAENGNPWKPGSVRVVRRERLEDRSRSYPGGGHPSSIIERFIEAMPATDDDYRAAQESDRQAAERRERKANPPLQPIRAGRHVDEVRADLEREGVTHHRGRWFAPNGQLRDLRLAELVRYRDLLLEPKTACHSCKERAVYVDGLGVPLCTGHAAEERKR